MDGGNGADTLTGAGGNDTLSAGEGSGVFTGRGGDDLIVIDGAQLSASRVAGDAGADTLLLQGEATVAATAFAQVFGIEAVRLSDDGLSVELSQSLDDQLGPNKLTVEGGLGGDTIDARQLKLGTSTIIHASEGDDIVLGGDGNEDVSPGSGLDYVALGTGNDTVRFEADELSGLDKIFAEQGVSGDQLHVKIAGGHTLSATAMAGVQGFDSFRFEALGADAGVRLPSNLVGQSGLSTASVMAIGGNGLTIDGRAVVGAYSIAGSTGNDLLLGGAYNDSISGGAGEDIVIGGNGGDRITLTGTSDTDRALLTDMNDGSIDINGNLSAFSMLGVDRVFGLGSAGNYISVLVSGFDLPTNSTFFLGANNDIEFGWGADVLNTANEIAGNNFGSLSAVQAAVGNRLSGGKAGIDDAVVLVIGGADETQFGVYYFVDRDDNKTVDAADSLYLLAIGDTDVPVFAGSRGFSLFTQDLPV